MSALLRKLWHLPLHSARLRGAAFTLAAIVLITAALLLADDPSSPQPDHRVEPGSLPTRERPSPPARELPAPPTADAKVVAGRFLQTYLPIVYDQTAAATLSPYATPSLVEQLTTDPPRRPATSAQRRSRARVLALTTGESTRPDQLVLSALIEDSGRTYTMLLTLNAGSGRWQVAALEHP